MPHISRNPLGPGAEKELVRTLEVVLTKVTKEEDMDQFLFALLSPTERLMLAKRLAMIVLLKENLPESSIAEMLHVTRGTVAKMQLFLEARGQGYEVGLKVLENEKLMTELKGLLLKLASYAAKSAGGRL
jgi:Trp operon repressor